MAGRNMRRRFLSDKRKFKKTSMDAFFLKNSKIRIEEAIFPLKILCVTWSTQNWLKWRLEKDRVVRIDGCLDVFCGKVRAGLQSNFLSPKTVLTNRLLLIHTLDPTL